jgi:hypothetical protein
MAVGVALAAPDGAECNVAVIGLGGGGLCTFLQHCFQKVLLQLEATMVSARDEVHWSQ